jgi:hypothetical protein
VSVSPPTDSYFKEESDEEGEEEDKEDEEINNSLSAALEQATLNERFEENCCVCLAPTREQKYVLCDNCCKPIHLTCLEECEKENDYGVLQPCCPFCRAFLEILATGEQTPVEEEPVPELEPVPPPAINNSNSNNNNNNRIRRVRTEDELDEDYNSDFEREQKRLSRASSGRTTASSTPKKQFMIVRVIQEYHYEIPDDIRVKKNMFKELNGKVLNLHGDIVIAEPMKFVKREIVEIEERTVRIQK